LTSGAPLGGRHGPACGRAELAGGLR